MMPATTPGQPGEWRWRWLRAAVVAWLVCWGLVAWGAYLVLPGSGGAP